MICGSNNNFGEVPFLGPKMRNCVPKLCKFLKNFTFLAMQGVILYQYPQFWFVRLGITLLCENFKDFGEIPFLGQKYCIAYQKYAIF